MNEKDTPYFYDSLNETVLLGHEALDRYLDSGGHPTDIISIAEALLDKTVPLPACEDIAKRGSFNPETAIRDGKFLIRIIQSYDGTKSMTSRVMERAWKLRIIEQSPSQVRDPKGFGSFAKFQEEIGELKIRRRQHFDDLSYDDITEYIRNLAVEDGSKPTLRTLDERSHKSGDTSPSSRVIRRLIAPKSFFDLYEDAGLAETTHNWTNERYESFGLNYMWANRGRVPSSRALHRLSLKNKGPTHQGVIGHFRYLTHFQDRIIERFNDDYDKLIVELQDRIKNGGVPFEITNVSSDEWKVVTAYLAYKTIEGFAPSHFNSAKVLEASEFLRSNASDDFQIAYPDIDILLMKSFAREKGVEGAIWPKESGLRQTFRVKKKGRIMVKVAAPQNGHIRTIKQDYRNLQKRRKEFIGRRDSLSDSDMLTGYIKERGQEIKNALEEGEVPIRLFAGSKNGKHLARRYETYTAIGKITPELTDTDKIRVSILSDSKKLSDVLSKIVPVAPETVENVLVQLGYALVD